MKRVLVMYFVVILFVLVFISSSSQSYSSREILVMFRSGVVDMHGLTKSSPQGLDISSDVRKVFISFNAEQISRVAPNFSLKDTFAISPYGRIVKKPDLSLLYKISFPEGTDLNEVVSRLSKLQDVVYAERLPMYKFCSTIPNDSLFSFQWGLKNNGQNGGVVGADINAPEAWDICTGSSTVKIGIIDCGVMKNHEDLTGKVEGDNTYHGPHGTHVAGIAAAITNNRRGVAGVDWNAPIYAKDVSLDENPEYIDPVKAAAGIIAAVDAGCAVLNNSWSGFDWSMTVRSAFAYAYKMNCVSVAATGNEYSSMPSFPASYPNVIAVGAMTNYKAKSPYSNYGSYLDVIAPGGIHPYPYTNAQDIISTWTYPDKPYEYLAGTSMAAPFVIGIAALLKSYRQDLYNDDIEEIIKISADDIGSPGRDDTTGYGKVNARKALDLLRAPYSLKHVCVSGAQTIIDLGYKKMAFIGVSGLADGVYFPRVYRVEKEIHLDKLYAITPNLWGCGVASRGFSPEVPNYGEGYTSVTSLGGDYYRLTTYVYDVYQVDGTHIRYFPCEPSQVRFAYSVLGIEDNESPVVLITSPNGGESYRTSNTIPIRWHVQDEYLEGVRCSISYKANDFGPWVIIASNVKVDSNGNGKYDYVVPSGSGTERWTIRVIANDTNAHQGFDDSDGTITVEYLSKPGEEPIPKEQSAVAVKADFISEPFPNPFNPITSVKFGLKNSGRVSIKIFDVSGKIVRTIYNGDTFERGEHVVQWDGRNDAGKIVPSGIYFLHFYTEGYSETRKLILLR